MTGFKYFTRLPPEIRNAVYELLIVNRKIAIASPRNRRKKVPPRTNFGCLLRVNKQIHAEAKTIFYARNTFILGNGRWGSREEANLHALQAFTSRVPKDCIALITKIEINIYFQLKRYSTWASVTDPLEFFMHNQDALELQSVARAVLKYFTGVESIDVVAAALKGDTTYPTDSQAEFTGYVDSAAKAMGMMLGHPNLRQMSFHDGSRLQFDTFVEKVKPGKEAKSDIISIVPFRD